MRQLLWLKTRMRGNCVSALRDGGECKACVDEATSVRDLLKIFNEDCTEMDRCGLLRPVNWNMIKDKVWEDCAGADLNEIRGSCCKILFESLNALWMSRHDD